MKALLMPYTTISIIGMAKNVGKTTTLNYLIDQFKHRAIIGLTSIGLDGETIDVVTHTNKPTIEIFAGMIVATAKSCLQASSFTKQILETTGITTPLGEVIIVRALSNGEVLLSGPSYNAQLEIVVNRMKHYGVDKIFIDGAVSRKGFSDSCVSDATILATGANYSPDMDLVTAHTHFTSQLLSLPAIGKHIEPFSRYIKETPVTLVDQNLNILQPDVNTALQIEAYIDFIDQNTAYLILDGAFTQGMMDGLLKAKNRIHSLTIVINHGAKCLFNYDSYQTFKKTNMAIMVLKSINLMAITINPTSITHASFDARVFKNHLKTKLAYPIYDVMGDK